MAQEKSLRDSLYLTDDINEHTFKYDSQLPNLPVPSVQESIIKLLDSIKPVAENEADFKDTQSKASQFVLDENVLELQKLLLQRSSKYKNWLEDWWLEFAYLRSRKPLIPYSNMAAPLPTIACWPIMQRNNSSEEIYSKVRAKRAALTTYFQLNFWKMLREERMRPMIYKGVPWSMSQFKYLFNTTRRPGEPKDELVSWFNVAREGKPASVEIVVLHKGYIFAIKPVAVTPDGGTSILPAPLIERQLNFIESNCSNRPHGPGVGCLTTSERTDWTEAREKLSNISLNNRNILDRIDRSLSILVLDENEPYESNEIFVQSICGDARNRWADKSVCSIAFKNGAFGASADHTPYDGFCTAIMTHYLITSVQEHRGEWNPELEGNSSFSDSDYCEPELLEFDLDMELTGFVSNSLAHFDKVSATIETSHKTFNHFGKALLKEHRFHPEAFVQAAIHASYYGLHGKMAPAYVTASTRKFFNGRTETCRSCFPEMKLLAQHLAENRSSKAAEAYKLIRLACDKFQTLMLEASNGHGCDRHLLGLYLTAILEEKPIPELFDDVLFQKTNNYILSTSCAGYWNVCGGVPPLVENGYGCFYGIEDDAITICCTSYKTCTETDLGSFYKHLETCLLDMQRILTSNSRL